SAHAKFCRDCGAPLDGKPNTTKPAASEPVPVLGQSDPSATEGERKNVTALFADIKGSMEMIENLDPEEARAIFGPALQLMIEAVRRYGGYVAQSTGDGIFAVFGAPIALEDHPSTRFMPRCTCRRVSSVTRTGCVSVESHRSQSESESMRARWWFEQSKKV